MKTRPLVFLFILILPWGAAAGQKSAHFYNLEKETTVEGMIQEIDMEPRYENKAPFLILLIENQKTGQRYSVETSPVWFFSHDLHKGEKIRVLGSLVSGEGGRLTIIAREVRCSGETIILRDERGFPNWRGGRHRGRQRGKEL